MGFICLIEEERRGEKVRRRQDGQMIRDGHEMDRRYEMGMRWTDDMRWVWDRWDDMRWMENDLRLGYDLATDIYFWITFLSTICLGSVVKTDHENFWCMKTFEGQGLHSYGDEMKWKYKIKGILVSSIDHCQRCVTCWLLQFSACSSVSFLTVHLETGEP